LWSISEIPNGDLRFLRCSSVEMDRLRVMPCRCPGHHSTSIVAQGRRQRMKRKWCARCSVWQEQSHIGSIIRQVRHVLWLHLSRIFAEGGCKKRRIFGSDTHRNQRATVPQNGRQRMIIELVRELVG